ncbi:hypothetical protein Q8F55_006322 [Vanrija albida]|uniref:Peptidase A1 domain-containing protein n=1 Tax=Vanrija albida TaxID=181172 RepID=A0ABR3PWY4_9TREE
MSTLLAAVLTLALAITHSAASDNGPVHLNLLPSRNAARLRAEDVAEAQALRRDIIFKDFQRPGFQRRQTVKSDWTLSNRANSRYSVMMAFGTPPQDFLIDVDTGSSELWVYDNACTPTQCGAHSSGFDASKSSTYKDAGVTGEIQYVSSYCRGPAGFDTIGITNGRTGSERATTLVQQQPFFRCNDSTTTQSEHEAPGNLGLAWYTIRGQTPLWLNLVDGWQDKRFSMYFARQNDSAFSPPEYRSSNGGVLTLGGINTELFVGDIDYIPMSNRTYRNNAPFFWEIPVDGAEYGGQTFAARSVAIVDTGNPFTSVPSSVFQAVYANLPGAQLTRSEGSRYAFPCRSASQLQPLTITLNRRQYTIPAVDLYIVASASGTTCYSSLDPVEDSYDE